MRQAAAAWGLSFALGALTTTALTWRSAQPLAPAASAEPRATGTTGDVSHQRDLTRSENRVRTGGAGSDGVVHELRQRRLEVPVDGIERRELRDTFGDARGTRSHEALDIMAARRTPVRAVEDGTVAKLFSSEAGGLTVYQFDPSQRFSYYYAHLDGYAEGLRDGQTIRRGDLIGYVGTTGNAAPDAPHLHFAIFELTAERQWWKGTPLNPYEVLRP